MQQLETKLDELLVKKAPFQLPENARRGLVTALPWLTLIGGVLMLFAAWGVWQFVALADRLTGVANELGALYNTGYVSPVGVSPLLWASLALILVEAVLFFIAFPALRAHQKKGWDILFWVSLVNIAQAVVQGIAYTNFGSVIMSLIGSAIGLYLLFQVRSYYTGEKKMPVVATATPAGGTPAAAPKTPAAPVAPTAEKPAGTTPPETKV